MTGGAGALASAMLSAAVASRADPVRFGRGRTYVRDGAVVDLATTPGVLTAAVIGSRPEPYRVTVRVAGGDAAPWPSDGDRGGSDVIDVRRLNELVPDADEMRCSCTCPDGPADPCKHAVAALLAFADQVAIRPELLAEWRSGPPADAGTGGAPSRGGAAARWRGALDDGSPVLGSDTRADRADADILAAGERPSAGSGAAAHPEPMDAARTPEETAFLGDPDDVVTDLPDLEALPVGSARIGGVDLAAIVSDALELIRSTYDDARRR